MNEPYRIRIAVAPQPMSRDEVLEYFEILSLEKSNESKRNIILIS